MKISWFGQACFQISFNKHRQETVNLVLDPFSKEVGLREPTLEADLLLVSHDHSDHNNTKAVKGEPFLIREAGEYEVKDIFIQAIPAFHDDVQGRERGETLIFTIEAEEVKLCHLGDLGQKRLLDEQLERIGEVDILMIPVGGVYTIDGKEAHDLVSQIEPRLVIPMHYALPNLKVRLEKRDKFLKAMGQKEVEVQKKLKLQKKDLPIEETKIVMLEP